MVLCNRVLNVFFLFSYSTIVISANTCNFNVRVKQALHNEGFHRNITYGITFNSDHERERWLYKDCRVGVEQKLPAGVYANPDELGDLRRTQRLNAIPKNKMNIELPTEQASTSSVFIIGDMMASNVYLWLPVHARYHRAVSGGGTARNEIGPPVLYLRCPDERLDMCDRDDVSAVTFLCNGGSKEKCRWKEIPYTMMTETLIWDVPVGNTGHYYIVAVGTATVIIAGSLYLLKAIHEYKLSLKKKQF